MKNKLIVMLITFVILIALTPVIFSKLMNAKFNQMINNLNKDGYRVKIVKDNSSYLETYKTLEVTIPAKKLNSESFMKNITFIVDTKFKNLPVTNVVFEGKVKNVEFYNVDKNEANKINTFLKKYIHFFVTTPNFKDYAYTLNDIVIEKSPKIGVSSIKGMFKYGDVLKNRLSINSIYIKDKKGFIEIKNLKNQFEGNEKESLSKTDFNVNIDLNRFKLQVNNVYSKTKTVLNKNVNVNSSFGFDKLIIPNIADANAFNLKVNVNGLDKKTLIKLSNANQYDQQKLIEKIFEKGFNFNIKSDLKNVKIQSEKFGGYSLNLDMKVLPTKNITQKANNNNFDFIEARLNLKTTPKLANIIMSLVPQSAFVFALAKKQQGEVVLNLELKNGKLYSEGQLIK